MSSNFGVATILVGLPALCHTASRGFSWLRLVFLFSVETLEVATVGVFCQRLVFWLPSAYVRFMWNLESFSRRQVAVFKHHLLWLA
jgi:hypothetical protein